MIPIGISPCPNDTFVFHAWIEGIVGQALRPQPFYADIQQLNQWALTGKMPLIKLSFSCFTHVLESYQLLPIGNALGFNSGPKIIAKTHFPLEEIRKKCIAIPGKDTTAHFLFNHLIGKPKAKHFCLYHEITSLIDKGSVDCGLIIHESRFTFTQQGFVEIADLGSLWHENYTCPLPLGGLAIHRALSHQKKRAILEILQASLFFARQNPESSLAFIVHHSQEKDPFVVNQHIQTYVNDETEQLSVKGIQAIKTLLNCDLPSDWLYTHSTSRIGISAAPKPRA